ncbi:MAG: sulfotransferase [Planctomycetes bacterium]|nr:sulfotransferase [Planctomycetota bacterium]
MYINLKLFLKAEYLALCKRPFRLRRWFFVLFFTGFFWIGWCVVAFGRLLDHLFFPGFRKQQVREPVFIIAPPRSGTTLTQSLLSLDQERFAHVKLYHTIFPAVAYLKLFQALARLDRRCGRIFSRFVGWLEKKCFGGWDELHPLRFSKPEEDGGFFVYTFVTEAIYLLFPYVDDLWEAGFADALPREDRRKLMGYYRSCLQRLLHATGPEKTLLSKATQASGSMDSLLEAFPDARFITIVRHPYQAVPSHVSLFYSVWRAHSPEIAKDSAESKAYARLAIEWYRHLHKARSKIDPRRYFCLRYLDLVRSPAQAIRQVYDHFGFEMSGPFRARLELASQKERGFSSHHSYTLEEFGLSKEWIQDQLGEVLDAYSLER